MANSGKVTEPTEKDFRAMKGQFVRGGKRGYDEAMDTMKDSFSFLESASLDDNLVDWDLDHHVMWMVQRLRVPNVGPIVTIMAICLTEKGVMRVALAVNESELSTYLPTFRQIVNSIQYGPSLRYQPVQYRVQRESGEEAKKSAWNRMIQSAWNRMIEKAGAIAGVVFFIALFGYAKWKDRKANIEAEPPLESDEEVLALTYAKRVAMFASEEDLQGKLVLTTKTLRYIGLCTRKPLLSVACDDVEAITFQGAAMTIAYRTENGKPAKRKYKLLSEVDTRRWSFSEQSFRSPTSPHEFQEAALAWTSSNGPSPECLGGHLSTISER